VYHFSRSSENFQNDLNVDGESLFSTIHGYWCNLRLSSSLSSSLNLTVSHLFVVSFLFLKQKISNIKVFWCFTFFKSFLKNFWFLFLFFKKIELEPQPVCKMFFDFLDNPIKNLTRKFQGLRNTFWDPIPAQKAVAGMNLLSVVH